MKKLPFTLIFVFLFYLECFSQTTNNTMVSNPIVKNGIGLGSVLAIVISWDRNKSILFAILHGVLGWLYVGYYAIGEAKSN